MLLHGVGVADHAAQKRLGRAGDVRQALGDETAGAALGGGEGQAPGLTEAQRRFLQPRHVRAKTAADLRQQRGHAGFAGGIIGGAGGQVQRHLTGTGVGGQRQILLLMEQVVQKLLHLRLRQAEDAQVVGADHLAVEPLQIGQQAVFRQIAALRGNAGQQHGGDAVGGKGAAGGGTHGVAEHGAALRQIGLPEIAGGHLPVEHGVEIAADVRCDVRMEHQRRVQRGAHRRFRHIVVGGTQPAGEYQQLCPSPCDGHGLFQPRRVVVHSGVVQHLHTGGSQQPGEERGIRIGHAAGQQLAAHGDDLRGTGHRRASL